MARRSGGEVAQLQLQRPRLFLIDAPDTGGDLSEVPAEGTNTVLVGHDDPFDAATGIYPEPMGVAFVMEPTRDDVTIVANVLPGRVG